MEIQQHNGVVVEVAVISARLRQAQREGEGGTKDQGKKSSISPLYIGGPRGGALGDLIS